MLTGGPISEFARDAMVYHKVVKYPIIFSGNASPSMATTSALPPLGYGASNGAP